MYLGSLRISHFRETKELLASVSFLITRKVSKHSNKKTDTIFRKNYFSQSFVAGRTIQTREVCKASAMKVTRLN